MNNFETQITEMAQSAGISRLAFVGWLQTNSVSASDVLWNIASNIVSGIPRWDALKFAIIGKQDVSNACYCAALGIKLPVFAGAGA